MSDVKRRVDGHRFAPATASRAARDVQRGVVTTVAAAPLTVEPLLRCGSFVTRYSNRIPDRSPLLFIRYLPNNHLPLPTPYTASLNILFTTILPATYILLYIDGRCFNVAIAKPRARAQPARVFRYFFSYGQPVPMYK